MRNQRRIQHRTGWEGGIDKRYRGYSNGSDDDRAGGEVRLIKDSKEGGLSNKFSQLFTLS